MEVEDICMQTNCENWLFQLHTLVSFQRMMHSLTRYLLCQYCQIKLELQICPVRELICVSLSHISDEQKNALLKLLDEFKECFDDTPGLCTVVQHESHLTDNFKPRQTRAYRVPELLKAEIEKQISKLLELDFVEETDSPMTSGAVCVTKPGKSVTLCCDYRQLNKYTVADSTPMKLLSECVYKVAQAKFISICDVRFSADLGSS